MAEAKLTGIYTLTPTHCGTGQTSGAVDLPIARESHTGLPVLPATSLKGAARHALKDKIKDRDLNRLFGPDIESTTGSEGEEGPAAGELVILEGRLLAYPLRSLQRPFLYATCPLILERLDRDLRALGYSDLLEAEWKPPQFENRVYASASLANQTLVVEDLVYDSTEVAALGEGEPVTKLLGSLLPPKQEATRKRLSDWLVIMPDNDFFDAVRRVTPVQARIRLSDDKTTTGEKGNLWYEETLPADCLFTVFLTKRAGLKEDKNPAKDLIDHLQQHLGGGHSIQLGGNETVGQGYCWWTSHTSSSSA